MSKASDFQQSKKYVEIDPAVILIAEPGDFSPKDGIYKFCNPRGRVGKESGFSKERMEDLYRSIVENGLEQPLQCRMIGKKVQLIAGERRLRCILRLLKNEKLVYCSEKKKKLPPQEVYKTVPCKLLDEDECNDEVALRKAMDENDKSAPLTAADYVAIVEHLVACGKTPKEIEVILDKNPAWVNHHINYRDKLPNAAFKALMDGEIPTHTATKLLEFPEEHRQEIWENATKLFQMTLRDRKERIKREIDETRTQVEIAEANLAVAEDADLKTGDVQKAKKSVKRAEEKYDDAQQHMTEFRETPPTMPGSTIQDAAESVEMKPLTPRALNRKKIKQHYIEPLWNAIENNDLKDPVTGEIFPQEMVSLAVTVADAIARQETDVYSVLRGHMIEMGVWKAKKR